MLLSFGQFYSINMFLSKLVESVIERHLVPNELTDNVCSQLLLVTKPPQVGMSLPIALSTPNTFCVAYTYVELIQIS